MKKKKQLRDECCDEVLNLIDIGLLQVESVDSDGHFCYTLTEDGYKVAKGEADMPKERQKNDTEEIEKQVL